ncbi:hypothetical protein, partial [Escherichia coli]|uniref:hypothetical protein n=1 Tax=Escherichia coli TaxID=562 RepID=UPI00195330DD
CATGRRATAGVGSLRAIREGRATARGATHLRRLRIVRLRLAAPDAFRPPAPLLIERSPHQRDASTHAACFA